MYKICEKKLVNAWELRVHLQVHIDKKVFVYNIISGGIYSESYNGFTLKIAD